MFNLKPFFAFIFFIIFNLAEGQTILLDDFNRADNNTVGSGWVETETVAGTGTVIITNQLKISSTTAGRDYVYQDISARYNSVFNTNTSTLTWAFNMRQSRADPSGFAATNYGVSFVIGCTSNDFLTGNGYAVVLGNSGTSDNLRLVRFSGGLIAGTTTDIIAPATDFGADYLTIKVTYNPVGDNWSLFTGSSLVGFNDPSTDTYTQTGTTISDATYTGNDLLYLGCLWNHNTAAADNALFDNILIPNSCVADIEPTVQDSTLTINSITSNTMTLNWIRGNGATCIIIAKKGGAVTTTPTDGAAYTADPNFGAGTIMAVDEYVVYSGGSNTVIITGLLPTTIYYFKVFEFSGSGCTTNYLISSVATNNATTIACAPPAEPGIQSSAANISSITPNSMTLNWTRGNGAYCIVVVKPVSAVTTPPTDGTAYTANSVYGLGNSTAAGEYIVYSGTLNSVNVTGLSASTAYYFSVYEFSGTGCNTNYLITGSANANATTLAAIVYNYYYGNIHCHSDYSDGDMDNTCNGANSVTCCFTTANTAVNFDFMGMSDHNHNEGPIMTIALYNSGVSEVNAFNAANPDFAGMYGMEWGTVSTGGHVNIYGIDQLVGWNAGNYDIFVAKGDYNSLFNLVASTPGAFAYLVHPTSTNYNNLFTNAYNAAYDNAIIGVSLRNGPYNSLDTTYSDPPTGAPDVVRYHDLLKKGYHVGPRYR